MVSVQTASKHMGASMHHKFLAKVSGALLFILLLVISVMHLLNSLLPTTRARLIVACTTV